MWELIRVMGCVLTNPTMAGYEWKIKNLEVAQSPRLDVSADLQKMLKSQRSRLKCQWRNELANKARASWRRACFLLTCPYIGFQQVWLKLKVCLPASRSELKMYVFLSQRSRSGITYFQPSKKSLSGAISGLWLIPNVVRLTTKNGYHSNHPLASTSACTCMYMQTQKHAHM